MKSTDRNRDEAGRASCADEAVRDAPPKSRTPRSAKGQGRRAAKVREHMPDALPPHDGEGRKLCADRAKCRLPDPSPKSRAGLSTSAGKAVSPVPVSASPIDGGEEGLCNGAEKAKGVLPASPSVDQLAELQVRRKFYIGAVNKQTNAVKALVRRALGWRYDEEEGDRDKVNGRAARIVAAALAGKEQKTEDAAVFGALAADLAVVASAIEPMQKARHEVELEMKRQARKLPIFPWAKDVKGLGELGLAVIVAEAGDLAKYPKKGHLWKRLGLAPHEGKAYSTWRTKGGLSAEQWTEAGYSPRRRAEVYAVISEPLFRAQSVVAGPYRAIYDRRREATAVAHPDWTKAHSHMDGLRVMTKYLIRDLWVAWRRVGQVAPSEANQALPAADSNRREAIQLEARVAPVAVLPTGDPVAAVGSAA